MMIATPQGGVDWREAGPVIGVLAVGAAALWLLLRSRQGFVVRAKGGRITIRGKFPPGHRQHVAEFLASAAGPVKVTGRWTSRGELVLRVSALSPGECQRIRNYLMTTLRPG